MFVPIINFFLKKKKGFLPQSGLPHGQSWMVNAVQILYKGSMNRISFLTFNVIRLVFFTALGAGTAEGCGSLEGLLG